MKPAPFGYTRPETIADALAVLSGEGDAAIPVAGGQSLVPMMSLRLTSFEKLVDISRLGDLQRQEETADHVFLGAATTHAMIEDGRCPDPSRGLMSRVAGKIAYRAVRNLGTIGGSVALADPAADWPACLIALDAEIVLAGPEGERAERADGFFRGPYETARADAEIIVGFRIRKLPAGAGWGVFKVARKSGAFSDSLAIAVRSGDGTARIALAGTTTHAGLLEHASAALAAGDTAGLLEAARKDIARLDPDVDPYRLRCHIATITRAAAEALS
jgi:carbon-monoxide dehydrogenase medium subunit